MSNQGEHVHESETKKNKLMLAGVVILMAMILVGLYLAYGPRWYRGYQPTQPIAFSHAIHAGQFKVPCLYCHGSAEYGAYAEIPGLETCMNCHSQVKVDSPLIKQVTEHYNKRMPIAWVKVHVLPDFVKFNHRPHIAAGVQCETCHGPVQEMDKVYQWADLNMGWCMNCHRDNTYLTEPRKAILTKRIEEQGGMKPEWVEWIGQKQIYNADVSCSTCHY